MPSPTPSAASAPLQAQALPHEVIGSPLHRLTRRLYLRLWLAVVLAVASLTLLVGWAWRLTAEPPLREAIVHDSSGQVLGHGALRPRPPPDNRWGAQAQEPNDGGVPAAARSGPEFVVQMVDGQVLHVHLPRPPRSPWGRPPFGFFWMLGLVAVAVALATYPIVRKLTQRLEQLQRGVERWGDGDLSVRVPVRGHDEVAYLAERFNHAAEKIDTLVRAHKSLLANASHELRSPLARIRMGLELAPRGTPATAPADTPPAFAWRDEIARNINELDQLIDEILLASRLDAREADMGTVEPVDLIGLAAEECARTGAELEVLREDATDDDAGAPALVVAGVSKLLRRAVRNLLENARRYGAGDVRLELSRQGPDAVLAVCDRGPGVPIELRERIFEPFYRLPGASEREGGVGLGLALVRSIAERHGGRVHCEDRDGGGARFVLTLPLN